MPKIILRPVRRVNLTERQAAILKSAREQFVRAGDRVRDLDRWRDDYQRRNWSGRVA